MNNPIYGVKCYTPERGVVWLHATPLTSDNTMATDDINIAFREKERIQYSFPEITYMVEERDDMCWIMMIKLDGSVSWKMEKI